MLAVATETKQLTVTAFRSIAAVARMFRAPLEGVRLGADEAVQLLEEGKDAFDEMGMKSIDEEHFHQLMQMFSSGQFPK